MIKKERTRRLTISPDNLIHKNHRKTVKIEPKIKPRYKDLKIEHALPTITSVEPRTQSHRTNVT